MDQWANLWAGFSSWVAAGAGQTVGMGHKNGFVGSSINVAGLRRKKKKTFPNKQTSLYKYLVREGLQKQPSSPTILPSPARWPATLGWRRRRRLKKKAPILYFFTVLVFLFFPHLVSGLRFWKYPTNNPRSRFELAEYLKSKLHKTQDLNY